MTHHPISKVPLPIFATITSKETALSRTERGRHSRTFLLDHTEAGFVTAAHPLRHQPRQEGSGRRLLVTYDLIVCDCNPDEPWDAAVAHLHVFALAVETQGAIATKGNRFVVVGTPGQGTSRRSLSCLVHIPHGRKEKLLRSKAKNNYLTFFL